MYTTPIFRVQFVDRRVSSPGAPGPIQPSGSLGHGVPGLRWTSSKDRRIIQVCSLYIKTSETSIALTVRTMYAYLGRRVGHFRKKRKESTYDLGLIVGPPGCPYPIPKAVGLSEVLPTVLRQRSQSNRDVRKQAHNLKPDPTPNLSLRKSTLNSSKRPYPTKPHSPPNSMQGGWEEKKKQN